MKEIPGKKLFTIPDVAKMFGVKPTVIRKLRDNGLITFLKLGEYKTSEIEIDRFISENMGKDLNTLLGGQND